MLDKTFDSITDRYAKAEIMMTPLIDMIFILLLFFVVTTSFIHETGIKVEKAHATTSQALKKNLVLVAIDTQGGYWYDKQLYPIDDLIPALIAVCRQTPDAAIVVIPDRNGRIEPLITILDHLRAKGITQFSIGTQRSE
jgi:biopolymer transport protein ExbD